jgi:DNA ligase-associated metallophosphoesterase
MGRPTPERTDDRTLDRSRPAHGALPRRGSDAVEVLAREQSEARADREQRAASEGAHFERDPSLVGAVLTTFASEDLILLPHRCAYWPRERTLFLADSHLGKTATFRDAGIPIPRGTTSTDLTRLADALDLTGAQRLVVLGDLLHHKRGLDTPTIDAFTAWRAQRPDLHIALVRGNHDRAAGDPPPEWRIECLTGPVDLAPFRLVHEPPEDDEPVDAPTLAGHIHPCVRLHGAGRQSMRAACFHFSKNLALFPSFGSFTGSHRVSPRVGDRVYAVGDDRVIEVTIS